MTLNWSPALLTVIDHYDRYGDLIKKREVGYSMKAVTKSPQLVDYTLVMKQLQIRYHTDNEL